MRNSDRWCLNEFPNETVWQPTNEPVSADVSCVVGQTGGEIRASPRISYHQKNFLIVDCRGVRSTLAGEEEAAHAAPEDSPVPTVVRTWWFKFFNPFLSHLMHASVQQTLLLNPPFTCSVDQGNLCVKGRQRGRPERIDPVQRVGPLCIRLLAAGDTVNVLRVVVFCDVLRSSSLISSVIRSWPVFFGRQL